MEPLPLAEPLPLLPAVDPVLPEPLPVLLPLDPARVEEPLPDDDEPLPAPEPIAPLEFDPLVLPREVLEPEPLVPMPDPLLSAMDAELRMYEALPVERAVPAVDPDADADADGWMQPVTVTAWDAERLDCVPLVVPVC